MAGPREGESGANFLRRLNKESYPYFQTPQADIQDMDEYDREALRNAAFHYMKYNEVIPDQKYYLPTNDPSINTGAELSALGMTNQGLGPLVNPDNYYREVGMDEQAALSAQNISGTPLGRIDFGSGPDTSLPEAIPTEAVMQFIGKLKTMGKDKVSKPYIGGFRPINPKDKPMNTGAPRRPESFDRVDLERNDRMHDKAMRGGDDTLSYTETGDIVIPNKVAQANPGLTMAAMKTIADMGANPAQYVAGSPEGSYNPDTGAQEFGWWEELLKMGVKGADYIGNSKFGQAALTGLGTAAASKYILGQDTKTALATGAGAGLGYGVGNYLENRANVKASELKPTDKNYAAMPEKTTLKNYDTADGTLKNLGSAAMDAFGNFSEKGLKYAVSGAGLGQMLAPVPKQFSPLNIQNPTATILPPIKKMAAFEENERPNLSATIPPPAPIAPLLPMPMPQGVTYQDRVRDRDTGEYRYTSASSPSDQSAFSRAVKGASRRKGLGFGNMILV